VNDSDVVAVSGGVRRAFAKSVLSHKAIAFGGGRGLHARSLRLVSPRCAQLRQSQSGVAVAAQGESLRDAQPLVLRRSSAYRVFFSFSRSPQPNHAFEPTSASGLRALAVPSSLRSSAAAQRGR